MQYCGGGCSVLWRFFITVEDIITTVGDIVSARVAQFFLGKAKNFIELRVI